MAPWLMTFDYQRTTGPVVGQFLAGLSERVILGLRAADGWVVTPPTGYHPQTAETMSDWVEVGPLGTVLSWSWVGCPLPTHPWSSPFAWALIRLDGSDTSMLHVVLAPEESVMRVGLRVEADWAEERRGHILDLRGFRLAPEPPGPMRPGRSVASEELPPPVERFVFPMRLHYQVSSGFALARCLRALQEGRFLGQRSPCGLVYMPPLGACSVTGSPTLEDVELPNTGTVVSFCLVNIPVHGQGIEVPFACADINIDGSDTTFLGLVQECALSSVRIGMRVEAIWRPAEEREMSLASVAYFRPIDEPDRDVESLPRGDDHA